MGEYFQTIADVEVLLSDADAVGRRMLNWLVQQGIVASVQTDCILSTERLGYAPLDYRSVTDYNPKAIDLREMAHNGLEINVGRQVFHTWQSDVRVSCPECKADGGDAWQDALGEWYEQRGAGAILCESCGRKTAVTEWVFEPEWGFGNLGFTFWNWPPLKQSFLEAFERQLGHRTVFVADKI